MAIELTLSPDNALAVESASPQLILAATAHELRLPVSHIKGFVSSLRRTDIAWDGETTRQFLEEIEVEADRLQELIDSLLSNGDHRRGVLNHELQPTKPAKLIQSAFHRVHLILRDRLVRLDVPECLPPFQMDRDGMERVIANLLENAVKFSPDRTPIEVAARVMADGVLEVVVADHGSGIAPEDRLRIFQPFHRSKTRTPGHGLGLAIALSIVRAHRGQIQVRERHGGGSRFITRIPPQRQAGAGAESLERGHQEYDSEKHTRG
jgi:two-component system sensor histidine kinase KdpD